VLEHDPDVGLEPFALFDHVATGDPGLAGGGPQLAGEDADGGGLAGPIRAQEAKDFAGLDGETDAVECAQPVIVAGQVVDFDCVHEHAPQTLPQVLNLREGKFWHHCIR